MKHYQDGFGTAIKELHRYKFNSDAIVISPKICRKPAQMKQSKSQAALSKMHKIPKRCENVKRPSAFYPILHEFVILIFSNHIFQEALKVILDKGKERKQRVKIAAEAALEELKSKHAAMRDYAISQKVPNQAALQSLNAFQGQLENSVPLSRALLSILDRALYQLLNDPQTDCSNFEQAFGKITVVSLSKFIRTEDAFPKFQAWEYANDYFNQKRKTTDSFSLDQLIGFNERYDLQFGDKLVAKFRENGVDVSGLQDERYAFMRHAQSDEEILSPLWPTIEEYKCYMLRVAESITEIMTTEIENGTSEKKGYKKRISESVNFLHKVKEISGLLKWIGGGIAVFIYIWNSKIKIFLISAIWG